jgi:GAF domain-containing protein
MGRRAKPPKGTADAKRQLARKSPKDEDSRVRDLEKRLADALQREAEALGRLQTRNRELAEAQEQQTATSEILRVIASSPTDAEPVFATILASALALCGGARGAVFTSDGERLYLGARSSIAPDVVQRYPMPLSRNTLSGRAILDNTVVHVPDVEAPEAVSEGSLTVSRLVGYRSALVAPMVRDGRSIGAIFVGRREPGPFGEKHIALLQTFADQAVIAIENVRLFTELQEKNRALTQAHAQVTEALEQQTATSEILGVISSSPTDVQPVFNAIAQSATRLCGGMRTLVCTFDGLPDDPRQRQPAV